MELSKFISVFKEQFIDADELIIHEETFFRSLDSWDSLTSMSIIIMIKDFYEVDITDKELNICVTVKDVFSLVISKL